MTMNVGYGERIRQPSIVEESDENDIIPAYHPDQQNPRSGRRDGPQEEDDAPTNDQQVIRKGNLCSLSYCTWVVSVM